MFWRMSMTEILLLLLLIRYFCRRCPTFKICCIMRISTPSKQSFLVAVLLTVCTSAMPQANSYVPDTIISSQPEGNVVYYSENATSIWQRNGSTGTDRLDHKVKEIVYGNDGFVYIHNFIDNLAGADCWIKGKLDGDTLRFPMNQKYYEMGGKWNYRLYTIMAFNTEYVDMGGETVLTYVSDSAYREMQFIVKGDSLVSSNPSKLIGLANATYDNAWSQFAMSNVAYALNKDVVAEMPSDVETEQWEFEYNPDRGDRDIRMVTAAIKGDNFYVKGLSPKFPEAVVTGHIDGAKMTLPSKQLLGIDNKDGYYVYMMGTSDSTAIVDYYGTQIETTVQRMRGHITFDYSKANKTLTTNDNIIINHGTDSVNYYNLYGAVAFEKFDAEPVVPANPKWDDVWGYDGNYDLIFYVYPKDANGNFINPDSLYYIVYNDDQPMTLKADDYDNLSEDLTLIPYYSSVAYCDGNYRDLTVRADSIGRLGVQAVYRIEGEECRSDIVYYADPTSISSTVVEHKPYTIEYFDMSGRRMATPIKGAYIKVVHSADGSKHISKVMIK